jgi:hypothetical protein
MQPVWPPPTKLSDLRITVAKHIRVRPHTFPRTMVLTISASKRPCEYELVRQAQRLLADGRLDGRNQFYNLQLSIEIFEKCSNDFEVLDHQDPTIGCGRCGGCNRSHSGRLIVVTTPTNGGQDKVFVSLPHLLKKSPPPHAEQPRLIGPGHSVPCSGDGLVFQRRARKFLMFCNP